MFEKIFDSVREKSPLIHCITNYVTVNDCANVILACGASPVMSDEIEDCVDITSISQGLLINIGTLNQRTVQSMRACIKKANDISIPVVLDPVGAGATAYRTQVCLNFIKRYKISVIRGNVSEIKALSGLESSTKGVDASSQDAMDYSNLDDVINLAKNMSKNTGAVIAISGKVDIITDGKRVFTVHNGNAKMSSITGTGCQSSCLIAAFTAACDDMLSATTAAVVLMGVAGDIALEKHPECGNSSYRNYIIDEISNMSSAEFSKRAKIQQR